MTDEITCQVPQTVSRLESFDVNASYVGDGTTLHDVLIVAIPATMIVICILVGMWIYHHHEWLKSRRYHD